MNKESLLTGWTRIIARILIVATFLGSLVIIGLSIASLVNLSNIYIEIGWSISKTWSQGVFNNVVDYAETNHMFCFSNKPSLDFLLLETFIALAATTAVAWTSIKMDNGVLSSLGYGFFGNVFITMIFGIFVLWLGAFNGNLIDYLKFIDTTPLKRASNIFCFVDLATVAVGGILFVFWDSIGRNVFGCLWFVLAWIWKILSWPFKWIWTKIRSK